MDVTSMTILRIFVSYDPIDAVFATQLITDLQYAGAEVITDRMGTSPTPTDVDDTMFEQFLNEELPRCQQLIVVQTPEALQSPRMRAIVDAALKHVQASQMTGVLRVVAPTLNVTEVQDMPPMWDTTPEFDASLDYPRALVKLRLHLGLSDTNEIPNAPPPATSISHIVPLVLTAIGNLFSVAHLFHAQRPATQDRPLHPLKYPPDLKGTGNKFSRFSGADSSHAQRSNAKNHLLRPNRYPHVPRRSQYILLLFAIALILGITSVTIVIQQTSIRAQSNANTHLAKIHTPIPTTHATTTNTSTQAPAPTATQAPPRQAPAPAPTATQAPSRQTPTPTLVPPTKAPTPTPTPKTCPPTIQYGSQGSWVKTLQQRLNTLGWRDEEGKVLLVDGIFGSRTQYAVKRFQTAHAPPVDGVVGPITWSALGYC
jgi:hypothetical protein